MSVKTQPDLHRTHCRIWRREDYPSHTLDSRVRVYFHTCYRTCSLWILSLTFRALHQECPPIELQSMTVPWVCQAPAGLHFLTKRAMRGQLVSPNARACSESVAMMQIVAKLLRGIWLVREITKGDNTCSLSNLSVSLPPCLSRPLSKVC